MGALSLLRCKPFVDVVNVLMRERKRKNAISDAFPVDQMIRFLFSAKLDKESAAINVLGKKNSVVFLKKYIYNSKRSPWE